jgi:four helix bundle protein
MGGTPHKKLAAWRKSVDLAVRVFQLTGTFPAEERFGLVTQIRRAAVSIPSNVAEGAARGSSRSFVNSLHVARGSLSELDTQIVLAQRLGYLTDSETFTIIADLDEIERILNGLIPSVRRRAVAGAVVSALLLTLAFL